MQLLMSSNMFSCICCAREVGFGLMGSVFIVKSLYLLKYGIALSAMKRSCILSVNLLCRWFNLSLMDFILRVVCKGSIRTLSESLVFVMNLSPLFWMTCSFLCAERDDLCIGVTGYSKSGFIMARNKCFFMFIGADLNLYSFFRFSVALLQSALICALAFRG